MALESSGIVTRTIMRVINVPKRSVAKTDFSGVDISGSTGNRNKVSSILYSPWASNHLYSHQNNWITLSILYTVTF